MPVSLSSFTKKMSLNPKHDAVNFPSCIYFDTLADGGLGYKTKLTLLKAATLRSSKKLKYSSPSQWPIGKWGKVIGVHASTSNMAMALHASQLSLLTVSFILLSSFFSSFFFALVSITMAPRKYFIHSAHYSLCLINATLEIRKMQFSISCSSL